MEYVLGCVSFEFHENPLQVLIDHGTLVGPGKVVQVPASPPGWLFSSAYRPGVTRLR